MANLGEFESRALIYETTLQKSAPDIVAEILAYSPRIVGIGIYIWNVTLCTKVVALLKEQAPSITVVLGGPEVSYETQGQPIVELADVVVCGEGEETFQRLCRTLLVDEAESAKILFGTLPTLETLAFPYRLYNEEDLAHRVVYVEASRGCPYRCQFCLSSLDKKLRLAPMDAFLAEMQGLLDRGATDFKFIDRTFNLRMDFSGAILKFFLARCVPGLSLHFEMVPDRLPEELRALLAQFPPGVVQLEIGIQSFNPEVSARIDRKQDYQALERNLAFLTTETHCHLHTDLIVGLPGESSASFAQGFNQLLSYGPHEIQVGVLKRLKGTPIAMHDTTCKMLYSQEAPFEILETAAIDRSEMDRMKRFARFWDLYPNSGNFVESTPYIWQETDSPYYAFMSFVDWLFGQLERTSHISLYELTERLFHYLTVERGLAAEAVGAAIRRDYHRAPGRKTPRFLKAYGSPNEDASKARTPQGGLARQQRHLGINSTVS